VTQAGWKIETEVIESLNLAFGITRKKKIAGWKPALQEFFGGVQFAVFAGVEERDVGVGALVAEIDFANCRRAWNRCGC